MATFLSQFDEIAFKRHSGGGIILKEGTQGRAFVVLTFKKNGTIDNEDMFTGFRADGMLFYRSTGHNSRCSGTWLPAFDLTDGHIVKSGPEEQMFRASPPPGSALTTGQSGSAARFGATSFYALSYALDLVPALNASRGPVRTFWIKGMQRGFSREAKDARQPMQEVTNILSQSSTGIDNEPIEVERLSDIKTRFDWKRVRD